MKIRFIIPVVAALCGMVFQSCNDDLNLTPLDRVTEKDYFKTETDLQLFTNPLYNNLLPKTPYDEQSDFYVLKNLSDLLKGGTYRTVPSTGGGWTFTDLRRINTFLRNVGNCNDQKLIEKYSAVARFFRAYFYAAKIARFGDVPWYDTELGSDDPALYKPRDSREYVMQRIIEDLDYAITYLPPKAEESKAPYRLTRGAAYALKARTCLYEGTFRKYHNVNFDEHDYKYYLNLAAEAASGLMGLSEYTLYSTGKPNVDYMNMFAAENANVSEYILAIEFSYATGAYHNATGSVTVGQVLPGYTKKMMNQYLMADGTAFTDRNGWQTLGFLDEVAGRDPRMAQSVRTTGYHRIGQSDILPADLSKSITGYNPVKFVQEPTASGNQVDRPDRSTCDMPVFRYAEVLLIYAEAKAELETLTQDDLDRSVNLIRRRVGMPDLNMVKANANPDWYLSDRNTGYPNVQGANKGVILEIRRERAVELVQEGFRWDDIVRWKAGSSLNDNKSSNYSPLYGMYFPGPGEYDLSGNGKTDLILYTSGTQVPVGGPDVIVRQIGSEDMRLSEGNRGYVGYFMDITRADFNETRDYLYPIPIKERQLNPNLKQNPGWEDGLDY